MLIKNGIGGSEYQNFATPSSELDEVATAW